MAEKNNATCSICGKGYYKCLSCLTEIKATPWKQYTDTSEHYKIFQVIRGYNTGVYTKEEAKEKLQSIDLSDLNELRDNIKKIIKDIIKEDKKIRKPIDSADIDVDSVVEQPSYVARKKKNYESSVDATDAEVEAK